MHSIKPRLVMHEEAKMPAPNTPVVVDTTIAEHVANQAHGDRYGIDWIYHDDTLGFLPAKPVRTEQELHAALRPTQSVAWITPQELDDLISGRPWTAGAFGQFSQRERDEYTVPLCAAAPLARDPAAIEGAHPTQPDVLDWLDFAHRGELRNGRAWSMYGHAAKLIRRLSKAGEVPSAEEIADHLVRDWSAAGWMPQMAWDFRGFAVAAIKRAAADNGLWVPLGLPTLPQAFFDEFGQGANDRVQDYARDAVRLAAGGQTQERFDFAAHLQRQRDWSERTFGPGARAKAAVDHIRKELVEIETDPGDTREWIDAAIIALDGAWRSGATPLEIIAILVAKQNRNELRVWPDWRLADPDKAIEHDRSHDVAETQEG